jgi:hypothetical protein
MSIKKGNRRRTRRDYNFVDFTVYGFHHTWSVIRKCVREMRSTKRIKEPV